MEWNTVRVTGYEPFSAGRDGRDRPAGGRGPGDVAGGSARHSMSTVMRWAAGSVARAVTAGWHDGERSNRVRSASAGSCWTSTNSVVVRDTVTPSRIRAGTRHQRPELSLIMGSSLLVDFERERSRMTVYGTLPEDALKRA